MTSTENILSSLRKEQPGSSTSGSDSRNNVPGNGDHAIPSDKPLFTFADKALPEFLNAGLNLARQAFTKYIGNPEKYLPNIIEMETSDTSKSATQKSSGAATISPDRRPSSSLSIDYQFGAEEPANSKLSRVNDHVAVNQKQYGKVNSSSDDIESKQSNPILEADKLSTTTQMQSIDNRFTDRDPTPSTKPSMTDLPAANLAASDTISQLVDDRESAFSTSDGLDISLATNQPTLSITDSNPQLSDSNPVTPRPSIPDIAVATNQTTPALTDTNYSQLSNPAPTTPRPSTSDIAVAANQASPALTDTSSQLANPNPVTPRPSVPDIAVAANQASPALTDTSSQLANPNPVTARPAPDIAVAANQASPALTDTSSQLANPNPVTARPAPDIAVAANQASPALTDTSSQLANPNPVTARPAPDIAVAANQASPALTDTSSQLANPNPVTARPSVPDIAVAANQASPALTDTSSQLANPNPVTARPSVPDIAVAANQATPALTDTSSQLANPNPVTARPSVPDIAVAANQATPALTDTSPQLANPNPVTARPSVPDIAVAANQASPALTDTSSQLANPNPVTARPSVPDIAVAANQATPALTDTSSQLANPNPVTARPSVPDIAVAANQATPALTDTSPQLANPNPVTARPSVPDIAVAANQATPALTDTSSQLANPNPVTARPAPDIAVAANQATPALTDTNYSQLSNPAPTTPRPSTSDIAVAANQPVQSTRNTNYSQLADSPAPVSSSNTPDIAVATNQPVQSTRNTNYSQLADSPAPVSSSNTPDVAVATNQPVQSTRNTNYSQLADSPAPVSSSNTPDIAVATNQPVQSTRNTNYSQLANDAPASIAKTQSDGQKLAVVGNSDSTQIQSGAATSTRGAPGADVTQSSRSSVASDGTDAISRSAELRDKTLNPGGLLAKTNTQSADIATVVQGAGVPNQLTGINAERTLPSIFGLSRTSLSDQSAPLVGALGTPLASAANTRAGDVVAGDGIQARINSQTQLSLQHTQVALQTLQGLLSAIQQGQGSSKLGDDIGGRALISRMGKSLMPETITDTTSKKGVQSTNEKSDILPISNILRIPPIKGVIESGDILPPSKSGVAIPNTNVTGPGATGTASTGQTIPPNTTTQQPVNTGPNAQNAGTKKIDPDATDIKSLVAAALPPLEITGLKEGSTRREIPAYDFVEIDNGTMSTKEDYWGLEQDIGKRANSGSAIGIGNIPLSKAYTLGQILGIYIWHLINGTKPPISQTVFAATFTGLFDSNKHEVYTTKEGETIGKIAMEKHGDIRLAKFLYQSNLGKGIKLRARNEDDLEEISNMVLKPGTELILLSGSNIKFHEIMQKNKAHKSANLVQKVDYSPKQAAAFSLESIIPAWIKNNPMIADAFKAFFINIADLKEPSTKKVYKAVELYMAKQGHFRDTTSFSRSLSPTAKFFVLPEKYEGVFAA